MIEAGRDLEWPAATRFSLHIDHDRTVGAQVLTDLRQASGRFPLSRIAAFA